MKTWLNILIAMVILSVG